MAPKSDEERQVQQVLASVLNRNVTQRAKGLDDLARIFDKNNRNVNLSRLQSKTYHEILENLFKCSLEEKQTFLKKKGALPTRLSKCADAVRRVATIGAPRLSRKVVLALVDHVSQTLPGPGDTLVEPLASGYIKALLAVFSHPFHVEHIAGKYASHWEDVVDFCIQSIAGSIGVSDGDSGSPLRGSPAPGTFQRTPSRTPIGRSASQKIAAESKRTIVQDILECLKNLVLAPNARVAGRASEISTIAIQVLQIQSLSVSKIQQFAFAVLNATLSAIQADDVSASKNLIKEAIPLVSYWWQGERASKDEMIIVLRDELIKLLLVSEVHLESLLCASDEPLRRDVNDLLDILWHEYSRRGPDAQLEVDDLTFSAETAGNTHFRTNIFALGLHNILGERKWAVVEIIAMLERLLWMSQATNDRSGVEENQPRKRQRTAIGTSRLRRKLKASDSGTQNTALQVVPFMVSKHALSEEELADILDVLLAYTENKQGVTASWAMLACASCALRPEVMSEAWQPSWRQAWHLAVHLLSLPGTSRGACVLLQAILRGDLLQFQDVSEDINNMVSQNGPAVLVDSSLALMGVLLKLRNIKLPSANTTTSHHIIRWVFAKWSPDDLTFASLYASHFSVPEVVNLLKACCGLGASSTSTTEEGTGGPISHVKRDQADFEPLTRYLVLLDPPRDLALPPADTELSVSGQVGIVDSTASFGSKKLILELLYPKVEDLEETCAGWIKRPREPVRPVSPERLHSLLVVCLAASILVPEFEEMNMRQSTSLSPLVEKLLQTSLRAVLDTDENQTLVDIVLRVVRPTLPRIGTENLKALSTSAKHLWEMLIKIAAALKERGEIQSLSPAKDSMDLDDEFAPESNKESSVSQTADLPRLSGALSINPGSFSVDTSMRLYLLQELDRELSQIGLVPDIFLDEALALPDNDFLSCRGLLLEMFQSDLVLGPAGALRVIERLGALLGSDEFESCEAALCLVIDIVRLLQPTWTEDDGDLWSRVGDLYVHFSKTLLSKAMLSPRAQMALAELLFVLLRVCPEFGTKNQVSSCRTTLLLILKEGTMLVRYRISQSLADIFGLYVLKLHDKIFVDVLESLPTDSGNVEGMAFRVLALSKLACQWPTLLKRCTYHIFETPGKTGQSTDYATRCLADVSKALRLKSPRDLFILFAPQILYTWLDTETMEAIPYSIFAFDSLESLLGTAQAEASALFFMRNEENKVDDLAKVLGVLPKQLVKRNFAKIWAYSAGHDQTQINHPENQTRGEEKVRGLLGNSYADSLRDNFIDILALFFDLMDQEDKIDKPLQRAGFSESLKALEEMKAASHSPAELPPNQQPMFNARYLLNQLFHLAKGADVAVEEIWTPTALVCVARKLFNTVHPALGSLHACSILRKIRVLMCLADHVVKTGYALEMLLHSLRPFLVDSECADDALGMSRYLLMSGSQHLQTVPSFLAGYALSTLASLRVFMESTQSSTTQESQFKATMGKAKTFHAWFSNYLDNYHSEAFKDEAFRLAFKAIVKCSVSIRSSGNAEKATAESSLLMEILRDGAKEDRLLNDAARDLALNMLCGDFQMPTSSQNDIIETDEDAIHQAAVVWKSCRAEDLSSAYLGWAGRVVGRSFAASGEIPAELLRESSLPQYFKRASGSSASEKGIVSLLHDLTSHQTSSTAGLAEAALRTIVSDAERRDQRLLQACERTLSQSLLHASRWQKLRKPPSESPSSQPAADRDVFLPEMISDENWLQLLSEHLLQAVPTSIILGVLSPVLSQVTGFRELAFPFIVHLVLESQHDSHPIVKQKLSSAMRPWLATTDAASKENVKLLINTLLYLRNQPYPGEASIAERSNWLEIDYSVASAAAARCGMYRTALLFAELTVSEPTRTSRRSSVNREVNINDTLLSIFENIDDPDAYYGLPEDPGLSSVLARLEYENDGSNSLAFRGAQYDSHIRRRHAGADQDGQALVKALGTLGLSGLSHSLLQTQQRLEGTSASLENTFNTARKLEVWNLPVSASTTHHTVTVYKAYQSITLAKDMSTVRSTVLDGLSSMMAILAQGNLNAASMRHNLGALAALTELDDILNMRGRQDVEGIIEKFQGRGSWMKHGRYEDVSRILSCRETSLSMFSGQEVARKHAKISIVDARRLEINCMLSASELYRVHQATQECLNISTSLNDLIEPCESLGLVVDAPIKMETATSLWDHGQMMSSIRLLQSIDKDTLRKQTIPVSRSDLLARIGDQVSLARLEKPHDIQRNYLEPALKELHGKSAGRDAGQVYHQFAMFCDQQLQDSDGLEDLRRLQTLRKGKSDEVESLKSMISSSADSQLRSKYNSHLNRAKQWLALDEQELRRVEQTRSGFVKLSLQNYLQSLIASDDHNSDALRFTAVWLERSGDDEMNEAVRKYLDKVPTRKFASLMNQLTSRLQSQASFFQKMLMTLVVAICVEHPYHGMYHIWSASRSKANNKDEVAVSRQVAAKRVSEQLATNPSVSGIWQAIEKTSRAYHALAHDRDAKKYKSGSKVELKVSKAAVGLQNALSTHQIPPPTMQMELAADKDYSSVPMIVQLEPAMSIASGISAPKIITAVGSDGKRYKQLVKGGNDDLRQDAIMEQVFAAVSSLLRLHRTTRQRNLGIRSYKVLPLTANSGIIEFVADTIPLHEFLMPAHEKYYPKDLKGQACRREISNAQGKPVDARISAYRKVTEKFHPVMRYFFMEHFADPDDWFIKRLAYTRSTAAISILGHVLGLGDRHGHNILLDSKTGEVVHIDLGVAFEMGRVLPVPELVPFRLTRDIVDGMGVTRTEGVFRRCCEMTLGALREETYSIMTILDVLRYDPLYSWSISPVRLAKLQTAQRDGEADARSDAAEAESKKARKGSEQVNEPSEADRALEVVRKKLSKSLSVTATVNDLINQATDERNLAVLYSGWAAYA